MELDNLLDVEIRNLLRGARPELCRQESFLVGTLLKASLLMGWPVQLPTVVFFVDLLDMKEQTEVLSMEPVAVDHSFADEKRVDMRLHFVAKVA